MTVLRASSAVGCAALPTSALCTVVACCSMCCSTSGRAFWFSAKAIGAAPIMISMIRPMPFWPSLEPWANETPVQVAISSRRTGHGGGTSPLGASNRALLRITERISNSSSAAPTKPTIGEISSAFAVSASLLQLTPSPNADSEET